MESAPSFEIYDAEAETGTGLTVRLQYPEERKHVEGRLDPNPEFGVDVFEQLQEDGYAEIAGDDNPIRPFSAGTMYMLEDGHIVMCRRDRYAPTFPLHHDIYAGFPREDGFDSAEDLIETANREEAEEILLLSSDNDVVYTPEDVEQYLSATLEKAGLEEMEVETMETDFVPTTDTLEVYDAAGEKLFEHDAFLQFSYGPYTTNMNALRIRRLPLSAEDILPIDMEGTYEQEEFKRFNRESFVFHFTDAVDADFGDVLDNATVYRADLEAGKVDVEQLEPGDYEEPFLGPDNEEVTHPQLWAPSAALLRLTTSLDEWIGTELEREKKLLRGESLLPDDVEDR